MTVPNIAPERSVRRMCALVCVILLFLLLAGYIVRRLSVVLAWQGVEWSHNHSADWRLRGQGSVQGPFGGVLVH